MFLPHEFWIFKKKVLKLLDRPVCVCVCVYRAFNNVLPEYKNLL